MAAVHHPHAPTRGVILCLAVALFATARTLAAQPATVPELLRGLAATGVDVIYSSDLVPADLPAPSPLQAQDPMARVVEALAAHHLMLRAAGSGRYIVTREAAARPRQGTGSEAATTTSADALNEVSVFASRYAYQDALVGEPILVPASDIERIPGAASDALQALRGAPGLATNLSSRPYVRGAMLADVLVQFDGVALSSPFHFRNFPNLFSAFDPFAVERIDLYTGGFPVQFGTRSAGVIDLAPRELDTGHEHQLDASLISYNAGSVGHAETLPIEWLVSARHSGDGNLLRPVSTTFGEPTFADLLGRLRLHSGERSTWTLGWLALDDGLRVGAEPSEERATARFRDFQAWLAWDGELTDALQTHTSLSATQSNDSRSGALVLPGAVNAALQDRLDSSGVELRTSWIYVPCAAVTLNFGAEAGVERAAIDFSRQETLSLPMALTFARSTDAALAVSLTPRSATQALFASVQARRDHLEAELGLRVDRQVFRDGGTHAQASPRFNFRFDPRSDWHLYASWGEFTQAQRASEWRPEDNQAAADPATRAFHLIAGAAHEGAAAIQWRLELYRNHWSSLGPYYDNSLNGTALLPELQPDRVRIAAGSAETAGVEGSARRAFGMHFDAWGTLIYARTRDDLGGLDVPRSWDQARAANAGLAWHRGRNAASLTLGWHSGWPRTPLAAAPGALAGTQYLLGARNSARWGDYLNADVRLAHTVPMRSGELALWIESTNVTDRRSSCCTGFVTSDQPAGLPATQTRDWLPRIVNAGFSWRLR